MATFEFQFGALARLRGALLPRQYAAATLAVKRPAPQKINKLIAQSGPTTSAAWAVVSATLPMANVAPQPLKARRPGMAARWKGPHRLAIAS